MLCHSFDFIKHRRYWEISFPDKVRACPFFGTLSSTDPYDQQIRQDRCEEEMIKELEERLVDAVTARTQGDVKMGIYLSGGLDSAAVAGIAVDVMKKKMTKLMEGQPLQEQSKANTNLMCFNVGFDSSTEYDETREYRPFEQYLHSSTDLYLLRSHRQTHRRVPGPSLCLDTPG
jgi:asparagine synthase (glutamine-hydrolysing)